MNNEQQYFRTVDNHTGEVSYRNLDELAWTLNEFHSDDEDFYYDYDFADVTVKEMLIAMEHCDYPTEEITYEEYINEVD